MKKPKSVTVVLFQDHAAVVHFRSLDAGPPPAPNVVLSYAEDTDWGSVRELLEACLDIVRQQMEEAGEIRVPVVGWMDDLEDTDDGLPF
jgi:hypothetical protein